LATAADADNAAASATTAIGWLLVIALDLAGIGRYYQS